MIIICSQASFIIELCLDINVHNTCGNEICLIESKAAIETAETIFRALRTDQNSS